MGERADRSLFLIRDRESRDTGMFDPVFVIEGIEVLHTTPRAPRAQRWV